MTRSSRGIEEYRSLGVLLVLMAVLAAGVIASCGGGGGGSDGLLCDQCGDDPDGPCVPSIVISPGENQPQCTDALDTSTNTCTVRLTCRRKVDSGQRRCFPLAPGGGDVDYQFRCDGSRPGETPRPAPTPTLSASPSPVPTNCGNNVLEGSEVCDTSQFGGQTCESRNCGAGFLSCSADCTRIDVLTCSNAANSLCQR